MTAINSQTIDQVEVDKFSAIADEWWDENGKFKPLHQLNPVRIAYIKQKLCDFFKRDPYDVKPLSGLEILDIGCGGGLLSVPLARLGANVTAIDASGKNIEVAKNYAKRNEITVNYRHIDVEELEKEGKKFDVVLNMEVVEHVADVPVFLKSSCDLVKNGGITLIATLNRTAKSYAFAIIGAEYILKWLPKKTHDWKRFLKPSEIAKHLSSNCLALTEIKGISYNLLQNQWQLSDDIDVNYMMFAIKE